MKFSRCASKDCVSFYCASLTGWQAALIFSFAVICYFTEGKLLMAESKLRTLLFVIFLAIFLPLELCAKRAAPQPVKPIFGYAYKIEVAGNDNCGKVKIAKRCKCPPKIFTIYEINYQKSLERDVQRLYITELEIDNGVLWVKTEKDGIFSCNITTGKVKLVKLPQGYEQIKSSRSVITLRMRQYLNRKQ